MVQMQTKEFEAIIAVSFIASIFVYVCQCIPFVIQILLDDSLNYF